MREGFLSCRLNETGTDGYGFVGRCKEEYNDNDKGMLITTMVFYGISFVLHTFYSFLTIPITIMYFLGWNVKPEIEQEYNMAENEQHQQENEEQENEEQQNDENQENQQEKINNDDVQNDS